MDEVSVWNIALTPAQINTMMSNPEGLTGVGYDATGLLGYWNFDDGTADDLTASNNNGIFESGGSTTLPIDLISFTGQFNNNAVVLDWTTASELNNDYFVVERATGNILEESNWSPIAKISGAGNTNILSEYMYLDNDVNSSESVYYYRIKQIDFDGQYSYSAVISVKSAMNHAIQVYPNPSTGNFKIVGLSKINNYNVEIYNSTGHLVRVYSSSENMNIDLSDQPIGIYLVKSGERVFRLIKE
jgi:uncharacterized protein involved in tellurium resistance